MCGISGYFGSKKIDKYKISKTLNLMKNRGPNSFGVYKSKNKKIICICYILGYL